MKIIYYYNPIGYFTSDSTEGHIKRALEELGHEVVSVHEGRIVQPQSADWLLFHKSGLEPEELANCFRDVDAKKVCWYFDKVYTDKREVWVEQVLSFVDKFFLTDETWAVGHPNEKFKVLHQGIGNIDKGIPFETSVEIGFTGSVYNERSDFVSKLDRKFGDKFGVFAKAFNQDLANLCESVKIFVAPHYPSDDYYWSSRVYITMGSGGFMIHPRLKGLEAEYEEDKEIVFYDTMEELYEKVEYYLKHDKEREKIRRAGYNKTRKEYTYKKRIEELVKNL